MKIWSEVLHTLFREIFIFREIIIFRQIIDPSTSNFGSTTFE